MDAKKVCALGKVENFAGKRCKWLTGEINRDVKEHFRGKKQSKAKMEKRKLLHSSIQFIIVVFYFGTGEAIKCRKYSCVTVAVLSPVPPNWAFLFSSSLPLVWISDMETPSSPDSLGVPILSIFSFFIIAFSMLFSFFALSPVIRIDRVRRQQQGSQFLLYTYIYIHIYLLSF